MVSPKNYQDKYREEPEKYVFDKNKFLDSSKINANTNKNIKRRDKYDFNDQKYRDRWVNEGPNRNTNLTLAQIF